MWIVLIIIAVVVIVIVKNNVTSGSDQSLRADPNEVMANSEFAALFAQNICAMFSEGGDHFKWMIANSQERMVKLEFTAKGVLFRRIEVNRHRLKETGTYDVDTSGLGFGASGYQDLPNGSYVASFRRYVLEEMKKNCPHVTVDADNYVKLAATAKKSW